MMNNICIIGGGNIGIACAVELSLKNKYSVTILTSKASRMNNSFTMIDTDTGNKTVSGFINVTDDYSKALENADIVLVTLPSFMIEDTVNKLIQYTPKIIYYIPGYGSKELFSQPLIQKGIIIAGLERVPFIARLKDLSTVNASKKKELSCAAINKKDTEFACSLLEDFFNIPCKRINSYLTISFTPSNPILHTARLYGMFKDFTLQTIIPRQIKFYAEWNDFSSEILIGMDKELEQICDEFNEIDLTQFKTIRKHYESPDIKSMTKKISGIPAFQNIYSPLKPINETSDYQIDSESRYFLEDFPFGLCNLKGYAEIVNIDTPYMDLVLHWYEKTFNLKLFDSDDKLLREELKYTGTPQRFGFTTKEQIIKYYQ